MTVVWAYLTSTCEILKFVARPSLTLWSRGATLRLVVLVSGGYVHYLVNLR